MNRTGTATTAEPDDRRATGGRYSKVHRRTAQQHRPGRLAPNGTYSSITRQRTALSAAIMTFGLRLAGVTRGFQEAITRQLIMLSEQPLPFLIDLKGDFAQSFYTKFRKAGR